MRIIIITLINLKVIKKAKINSLTFHKKNLLANIYQDLKPKKEKKTILMKPNKNLVLKMKLIGLQKVF